MGKVLLAAMLRQAAGLGAHERDAGGPGGKCGRASPLPRDLDFSAVGIRKGYYKNNGEDAVLMTADRMNGSGSPRIRRK